MYNERGSFQRGLFCRVRGDKCYVTGQYALGKRGRRGGFWTGSTRRRKEGKKSKKGVDKAGTGCYINQAVRHGGRAAEDNEKSSKKVLTKPLTSVMIVKLSARVGGEHEIANLKKVEKRA